MNKSVIISNSKTDRIGDTIKLTITYPHQKVVGYDTYGRNVTIIETRTQVFYGLTKQETKDKAKQYLANEQYEATRMFRYETSKSVLGGLFR